MSKHLLILQHVLCKRPGKVLLRAAEQLNVKINIVKLWRQNNIPPLTKYDGLVVLDGRIRCTATENALLQHETKIIADSLNEDRPYLGIGMGHLLMAQSQGAIIGNNYCTSVGFTTGHLTHKGKEHPLFKGIPPTLPIFKWHSQAIMPPIPIGMDILATSIDCQYEAISIPGRPHIAGLQFINNAAGPREVKRYITKDTWPNASEEVKKLGSKIMTEAVRDKHTTDKQFSILFANFINMI